MQGSCYKILPFLAFSRISIIIFLAKSIVVIDLGDFLREPYLAADKWLDKIGRGKQDVFNLDINTMRLMVLYGMATDPGVRKGAYIKRFNDKADGEIKKLESAISHLAKKKGKYPQVIIDHFTSILTAYTALRSLYKDLVTRGKAAGSVITSAKLVHEKKKSLPKVYKEIVHPRKTWIEEEMDKLAKGVI